MASGWSAESRTGFIPTGRLPAHPVRSDDWRRWDPPIGGRRPLPRSGPRATSSTKGQTLSNIAPLLDRNRAFARDPRARQNMPRLPFIPNQNLYIVTCIDPRVDPVQILGLRLGNAIVQRDIGGRITPAIISDIAYIGYLVDTKAPEGPYFEVAIIQHTDCGSTLLADDELRHGFAQRIGVDERTLADTPSRCFLQSRRSASWAAQN
jgi:carbonic anhydrase